MNIGRACAIFKDIKNEKYSLNEKGVAIIQVLSMPTTNSITKADFKNALAWLWNEHFQLEDDGK